MMLRRVGEHAREILPAEAYRSPLWHEARRSTVSASEIAVILGLSPYDSPFNLWWAKKLGDGGHGDTAEMSRGLRCEPLVLEDFNDDHPELRLERFGLVQRVDRPWQVFTPDAVAYEGQRRWDWSDLSSIEQEPVAVVEAKTSNLYDEWGERGTDEVPVYYRAQVLWQMDVVGVDVAYLPVWVGFDYRCYRVEYDADDADFMRAEAWAFLTSVDEDRPPPIDQHAATTARLKQLHPTVVDEKVEVPPAVVAQYRAAKRLEEAAKTRRQLAENRLRAALAENRVGVVDGSKVCSRAVFDVKARVQTITAHTQDRLTVSMPKPPKHDKNLKRGSRK